RFEIEVVEIADAIWRTAVGERDAGDTGQRRHAAFELAPERRDLSGLAILSRGQPHRRADDVVRVEAEIDLAQRVEAGEEQPRHDEERRGDGELRPDEKAADAANGDAAG